MAYRIQTTDGSKIVGDYADHESAVRAVGDHYGWADPVASEEFAVQDSDGAVRYASCVYETDEECEADEEGAYAPRIVRGVACA